MKRWRIVFRPEAETDLLEIYQYIVQASSNIKVAFEFTERLRSACFKLEYFPERGAKRDEIMRDLRILTHERKTVIAYFIIDGIVIISNIFHAGRDWEAFIADQNGDLPKE